MPVVLGPRRASRLALVCLGASLALSLPLFVLSPLAVSPVLALVGLGLGAWLLLPAVVRLAGDLEDRDASELFNRASFYPLLALLVVLVHMKMMS